jgi:CBS-domain-containing membrane protein
VAVGLAMIVMHAADSFHPPAAFNPLLIVVNDRPWSFFVIPVAAGVAILVAFTFLWHNVTRRGSWPEKKKSDEAHERVATESQIRRAA